MLTVHVRVNDAATAKPTPVRLRLSDGRGTYFAPLGRLPVFATDPGADVGGSLQLGEERFAYIDGTCEVRLPAWPILVEASKGPEYVPLRREVVLGAGQISLRLAIERWIDLRGQAWYAGDSRAHELSPHAALLEGQAEDLAVVNLLARQHPAEAGRPAALSSVLAFSGAQPALEGAGCQVVVNTYNRHPVLGSVGLLNCHRAVYPLRFGPPDGAEDWSVADWCDQCHRKRGLVVWSDGARLTAEEPQGEALAAVLLGKVDAFEISRLADPLPPALELWYRLLDCGRRLPLVGGSGKESNAVALGSIRTYAQLEPQEPFAYGPWIEAVRSGRTFITTGPILNLRVDDGGPGGVIPLPPAGRTLAIRCEAHSACAFDYLELLHQGQVVARQETTGTRRAASLELNRPVTTGGWLAARCGGQGVDGRPVFAHTSAVFLQAESEPVHVPAERLAPLRSALEQTQGWVATQARAEGPQRERLLQVCQAGLQELEHCQHG